MWYPIAEDLLYKHLPVIVNAWYPGEQGGTAVAEVLFGDYNPGGKLTVTFPKSVGQIPLFYNHKNTGRPLPQGAWFQKFRSNYLDALSVWIWLELYYFLL